MACPCYEPPFNAGRRRRAVPPPPRPVPLHHVESGDAKGLAVVLLHGFPYDGRMWKGAAQALANAGYRAIVPDLRGFGKSAVQPTASMQEMAADVAALLEAQKVRRAVVLGFSMGGYVALQMAIRHAEQVAGLALIDTRAEEDTPTARAARMDLIARVERQGMAPIIEGQLPKQTSAYSKQHRPGVAKELEQLMQSQDPKGAIAALRGMAERPDVRSRLAGLGLACLVVNGEEDPVIPLDDAIRLAQHFRGSSFEAIPKTAHAAPLEDPERFHKVLLSWLKESFVA